VSSVFADRKCISLPLEKLGFDTFERRYQGSLAEHLHKIRADKKAGKVVL